MIRNFVKIAWRNLFGNKVNSFINIIGLSVGMAVAILLGLWIYDELSFNKSIANYSRIGQIWQFVQFTSEKSSYNDLPIPLAQELRAKYPGFKFVSLSVKDKLMLVSGEKQLAESGNYVEPDFTKMMSLKMVAGNRDGLNDINSILLSQSLAKSLFGVNNPINKIIKINNKENVKVTGVYEDFPNNTEFKDVSFLAPWSFYEADQKWVSDSKYAWDNNSWQIYAQLNDGVNFRTVSSRIKDIRMKKDNPPGYKPEFFIFPMSRWHLYGEFQNGVNTGGLITFVWLFGIIGAFVLLLACINFMNLSTARSEKRAREVGIRKVMGSYRRQLIIQFLSESLLVTLFAFVFSLVLAVLILPFFNQVSGKQMTILWSNPLFWTIGFGFSFLTGLIAGSYPALYLSSFRPIKVLKGTFRVGRFAAIPRQVLVVLQFTISVTLIIGTIVVFRQIQFAKNRPMGYSKNGLIEIKMSTPQLYGHYESLRTDILNTEVVSEICESSGSITGQSGGTTDTWWQGKDPNSRPLIMTNSITHDYGKAVGWHLAQGRDFSRNFLSDSSSIILNEAAVKLIGFKSPVGETIKWHGKSFTVIGIVKDMVRESPFSPVKPSVFALDDINGINNILIRLSPMVSTSEALAKVENVFKRYDPSSPFDYTFVDEQFGKKFSDEERIGKLSGFFTMLAVFISCLGLFGLASFVAEQRIKEIGVRKVLGASVFNLWRMLSKEFMVLIFIALLIAGPIAYYGMSGWLRNYSYRTTMSWWIFAAAALGATVITLTTVSIQGIKAAMSNPVKSLRTE
jgi:putative ABC transport system permease protein